MLRISIRADEESFMALGGVICRLCFEQMNFTLHAMTNERMVVLLKGFFNVPNNDHHLWSCSLDFINS